MTPQIDLSEDSINNLKAFMEQNEGVNFKIFNLLNEVSMENLDWTGFEEGRSELSELLKGYQRLIRITPKEKEASAFLLLKNGLHSALQICTMTRKEFMKKISPEIPGDIKTAERIYANALEKRGVILLQYMNMLQNNEPHINAARFN